MRWYLRVLSSGLAGALAAAALSVPLASADEPVAFVSPVQSLLTGLVDIEVAAPPATTSVRFSMDGAAFAEVTNVYAKATGSAPRWKTATDASWFTSGAHSLTAEAVTPTGVVTVTKVVTTTRPADPSNVTNLDGPWLLASDDELPNGSLDGASPPGARADFNESAMTSTLVPSSYGAARNRWNSHDGHRVILRKRVELGTPADQLTSLVFESCFFKCQYFVNGKQVGASTGGYLPYRFDVSSAVIEGNNTIAVIVDNRNTTILPYSATHLYWQWGGLLDSIRIERTKPTAITSITAEGNAAGTLTLRAQGVNTLARDVAIRVPVTLFAPGSTTPTVSRDLLITIPKGGGAARPVSLTIDNPRLWSLNDPARYKVVVDLPAGLGPQVTAYAGFRDVAVAGKDVTINGVVVSNLPGFNQHADYPGLGRVQPDGLAIADVEAMHAKGYRIFRPGHYPTTSAMLDAADRLGMLVIEEVSVQQKGAASLSSDTFKAWAKDQLGRMIDRDRGHPSVVIWSVGNENATNSPEGAGYVRELIAHGRELDPSRLYTEVSAWHASDLSYGYQDLVLANVYYGWYSNTFAEAKGLVDEIQSYAGDKPIMVSEYGAEAVRGRTGTGKGSEYYQALMVDEYNRIFGDRPHTLGIMYWSSAEFMISPDWSGGNPTPAPPFHVKGLRTWFREPKLGWKVLFAPVRIRAVAPFTPSLPSGTPSTINIVLDDVGGKGASGTVRVTPPSGYSTSTDKPFTLPPNGSVTIPITLAAQGPDAHALPGLVRAVMDQDTEAMPRLLVPVSPALTPAVGP